MTDLVTHLRAAAEQENGTGYAMIEPSDASTAADEIERLRAALRSYISGVPAFRNKPIGEAGSPARNAQDAHIATEDAARAVLKGSQP